ncbi:hypothetical protein [Pandoraea commovens]|uniref:CopG family transcriptional regulator n=1 Tax=Pandoraea commovens TaxID=2508289 RepID=A0ABY5QIQ4_9BURK|nr:hypothetical protein [Pandoraea commovens]UVA80499.1 hypothetical protein NTU39_05605 [Pandoraea commovens]
MYLDPKCVRDHRITLRLNDAELDVITSMAKYLGEQPAALARQLMLRQAAEAFGLASTVSRDAA